MPKKPSKNGRQNYDWEKIKNDYITDFYSSQKKISEKYGISLVTVAKRSKADDWFAAKKEYQRKVSAKLIEKVSAKKADELANTINAAANIADAILRKSQDPDQFCRYIVQEGNAESYGSSEYVFEKMDMKAAKEAIAALKGVDDLLRGYYNIQKADALERARLERERFEFEKQKAELFKPTEGNVIRIEGFDPEWAK